jgi:hypothetical protein
MVPRNEDLDTVALPTVSVYLAAPTGHSIVDTYRFSRIGP